MKDIFGITNYNDGMYKHIMQTDEWGNFKTKMGTPAYKVDGIQYTKHKIPNTNFYYAYAAKTDPTKINWPNLKESLIQNNCFVINFDVPMVIKGSEEENKAINIFKDIGAIKSNKSTFTKNNVVLDISSSKNELLAKMKSKHRYNIKYAQKQGIVVKNIENQKELDTFYDLLQKTAKREGFLNHPKKYYETLWQELKPKNMVNLLIAYYKEQPLVAWFLMNNDGVLYYSYGGSSIEHRNKQPSSLVAWESIKLGKELNCHTFDMWGACKDLNNQNDPEWGFTNFKLRFGADFVEYMDSYDVVLNSFVYWPFRIFYPMVKWFLKRLR